ncbi:putative membrane protein [Leptospira ryugenii]|uniref:Putative membrane protein n=1 Tax=Leptospira ryugenii TaxID=1917863 RepID=A0A2P2E4Z3_9LEPT|nr:hypothetical protein [Leptospira ryugenii]GBF51948.1 putative membrane protein [Leptospira ryugenii]
MNVKKIILFLLLLVLGFFHLRYLSRTFDWDSCVYALNIQKNRWESAFFNPHHLGFESSGLLYWKWIQSVLKTTDIMFFLRLRILAVSLLFLGFFIWILYRLYEDFFAAILLGLLVQFSQAFWFYSYHNDTPLIHSCLMAVLFLLTLLFLRKGLALKHLALLWCIQLLSIYFHQSNVIHFGIVPMAILLEQKRYFGVKLRLISIYLSTLAIATVLSYLFVGFIILKRGLGPIDEKHFSFWMFLYAAINRWGMSPEEKNYVLFFYRGIGDAFLVFQNVVPKFRVDFSQFYSKTSVAFNLNAAYWLTIIMLGMLNFKSLLRQFKSEIILLTFWLIPSIGFYTWWEGYFFEFWVGTSIALWLLSFYVLKSYAIAILPQFSKSLLHSLFLVMVVLYFLTNFTFSTLPRSVGPKFGYIEGIQGPVLKLADESIYQR